MTLKTRGYRTQLNCSTGHPASCSLNVPPMLLLSVSSMAVLLPKTLTWCSHCKTTDFMDISFLIPFLIPLKIYPCLFYFPCFIEIHLISIGEIP